MKLTVVVTLVMTDACGDGHGDKDVCINGFQAFGPDQVDTCGASLFQHRMSSERSYVYWN